SPQTHAPASKITPAMPPQTPSQLLPGLIIGANLALVNRVPNARPAKYAKMSATQTNNRMDNRKLMPITRAWAMASQASHTAARPPISRTGLGTRGQPATPARSSHAPSNTQAKPTQRHSQGSAIDSRPSAQTPTHSSTHTRPSSAAATDPQPLRRPHSHAPAAVSTSVIAQNGCDDG